MRILIAGAGVAGNTAAFWLAKLGHAITVVERAPGLRTSGLQVDLRGHAVSVLKRMGLDEAFRARAVREEGLEFVDAAGRTRASFPANQGGRSFSAEYEIMRGDLCRILHDAVGERVEFMFGNSVARFEETSDSVRVCFADGTAGEYDLLIGADGQSSRTRRALFGSSSSSNSSSSTSQTAIDNDAAASKDDGFHPLNDIIAYYTLRRPAAPTERNVATIHVGLHGRTLMVRRNNPRDLLVYIGCKADNEKMRGVLRSGGDTTAAAKHAFGQIYKGAGWIADEVVSAAQEEGQAEDFYCVQLGVVKLQKWRSEGSRVVLLGDAAWCPSPNTGMGTTAGVVGAYILAGEIGRHCGRGDITGVTQDGAGRAGGEGSQKDNGGGGLGKQVAAAHEAYERTLRPFVDHIQHGVLEDKGTGFPESRVGIWAMYLALSVMAALRMDVAGYVSIKGELKGWEVPEYGDVFGE